MSLTGNNILGGASGQTTGYDIDQSLRFDDGDSPKLTRTPSSAGNRKTWTWSGWVKRGNLDVTPVLLSSVESSARQWFGFYQNNIYIAHTNNAGQIRSDAVFRDSSAWYHIVFVWDTTQSTASNRIKCYVNGEQISFSIAAGSGYPALNHDGEINNTSELTLGSLNTFAGYYLDGYLAELHFIDGQALTPASFGETNEDTNQWQAIKYAGSYGTNGFYLKFQDSAALGDDSSGNTNDFTATNLVATDQVLDSPTNNFATLNPLIKGTETPVFSEGNLRCVSSGSTRGYFVPATIPVSSGKWYAEFCVTSTDLGFIIGAMPVNLNTGSGYLGGGAGQGSGYYGTNGQAYNYDNGGTQDTTPATAANGDIIGVALDMDDSSGKLYIYRNNTILDTVVSGDSFTNYNLKTVNDYWAIAIGNNAAWNIVANFGQDSSFAGNKTAQGNTDGNDIGDFYYTPPSGYLALCSDNLSDPSIADPTAHFNTVLYTGDGSTQSITGVGFEPDFLWVKDRDHAGHSHRLADVVRGATKQLNSDTTLAEATDSTVFSAFDSDGFSIGTNGSVNANTNTYVSWNWKAGGTASSNSDGTITSSVSANTDAGFSVGTYTGNGTAGATVGHGLSTTPEMIIIKNRDDPTAHSWIVYHKDVGATKALELNSTSAEITSSLFFNNTAPTPSVFSIGTGGTNTNTYSRVFYAFTSIDGYSKVGSYTGNGSLDGAFIYTGFRVSWVLCKSTASAQSWRMVDSERSPYNTTNAYLKASGSDAESTGMNIDLVSNGFKLRTTSGGVNNSETYIYLAFADSPGPFKYSNAR